MTSKFCNGGKKEKSSKTNEIKFDQCKWSQLVKFLYENNNFQTPLARGREPKSDSILVVFNLTKIRIEEFNFLDYIIIIGS